MKEYVELRARLAALTKYIQHDSDCKGEFDCTCSMVPTKKLARESLDTLGMELKEAEARRGR